MKRILFVVIVALFAATLAPAQSIDFATFQAQFQDFATAVAGTLASTATSSGLNWAPAYIGQLPHLGLGVSAGASLIPYTSVQPIFTMLGVNLPAGMEFLQTYGIPLPGAAVDARIGGFLLPFDIGLKFGYLPPQVQALLTNISLDYLMAGADVRLALTKDEGLMPAISVGVGYTYLKGSVGMTGIVPSTTIDVSQAMNYAGYPGTHTLTASSPALTFDWQSSVIEAKVQLSKQILFLIPNIGLSAAYGISSAGGGISSTLSYAGPNSLATVQQVFAQYGYPVPSDTGIAVNSAVTGWSVRAFGGVDLALLILHVDVSANYNLLTGSLGGGVNLRIQI